MKELKNWFRKWGYPEKVIREQVNRALRSEENVKEKDGQHMKENGIQLVVTYNLNYKKLSFLIRKNFQFFMQTQKLREVLRQHLLSLSKVLRT